MSASFSGTTPAARSRRHRGLLIWGIIILLGWWFLTQAMLPVARTSWESDGREADEFSSFLLTQIFTGILLILAIVFLTIGIIGEVRSARFNRTDRILATAMDASLAELSTMPRQAMYRVEPGRATDGSQNAQVSGAMPIEVERHFDQQTAGNIGGSLQSQMSFFGSSIGIGGAHRGLGGMIGLVGGRLSGTTQAELTISETTRANLMADALFSTYATGDDTWRLIAMPTSAAHDWLQNLLIQVWIHYGSDQTHTGRAVGRWVSPLANTFAATDVSYATDRLHGIVVHPYEQRSPVHFSGPLIGRNAVLAAELVLPDGTRLELLPTALPMHLAAAVSRAEQLAQQQLDGAGGDESLEGDPTGVVTS